MKKNRNNVAVNSHGHHLTELEQKNLRERYNGRIDLMRVSRRLGIGGFFQTLAGAGRRNMDKDEFRRNSDIILSSAGTIVEYLKSHPDSDECCRALNDYLRAVDEMTRLSVDDEEKLES